MVKDYRPVRAEQSKSGGPKGYKMSAKVRARIEWAQIVNELEAAWGISQLE